MFTYNRLDMMSSIGLEHSMGYYNQVQAELKSSPQLRETINAITTALNLPPLTEQELEDSLSTFKVKSSDDRTMCSVTSVTISSGST